MERSNVSITTGDLGQAADRTDMDPQQRRLLNETRRMRQRALARGDVRAAHACNVAIAALRRAGEERRA